MRGSQRPTTSASTPTRSSSRSTASASAPERTLRYLGDGHLARIATVGKDGTPHVTPVGFSYNAAEDSIDVGGFRLEQIKKHRDVARTGRAALVVDDNPSVRPRRVRGIEVRGHAETLGDVIRIHPERIISWGIHSDAPGEREARTVFRRD